MAIVDQQGNVFGSGKSRFTNRHLHQFFIEADQLNRSLLGGFVAQKLRNFYLTNSEKHKALKIRQSKLSEEYFEMIEDKSQVRGLAIKMNDEGKPILLEGKSMEEYQQKLADLFNEPVHINI